jgi:hypothetical protein
VKTSGTSGETYYYNTLTGKAAWDIPSAEEAAVGNDHENEHEPESEPEALHHTVSVVCPAGAEVGAVLAVTTRDGHELDVEVPAGVKEGEEFHVSVPPVDAAVAKPGLR